MVSGETYHVSCRKWLLSSHIMQASVPLCLESMTSSHITLTYPGNTVLVDYQKVLEIAVLIVGPGLLSVDDTSTTSNHSGVNFPFRPYSRLE